MPAPADNVPQVDNTAARQLHWFKPIIEIGEEGSKQSFMYRLQPGYFKSVCAVCHQRIEEGKDCSFYAMANANNMERDIQSTKWNGILPPPSSGHGDEFS